MIKSIKNWMDKNKDKFKDLDIKSEIAIDNDNVFAFDFISKKAMARITCWKEMFLDIQALETKNGKTILFQHFEFNDFPEYDYLFSKLFEIIISGKNINWNGSEIVLNSEI